MHQPSPEPSPGPTPHLEGTMGTMAGTIVLEGTVPLKAA